MITSHPDPNLNPHWWQSTCVTFIYYFDARKSTI